MAESRRSRVGAAEPSALVSVVAVVAAVAMVALQVVHLAVEDDRPTPASVVAFGLVPLLALAAALALTLQRRRWVAAAAALVAVGPAVLMSVLAAERHGAIAALGAAAILLVPPPAWRSDIVRALAAVAVLGAMALWWRAGVSRGRAPGPDWSQTVRATGDLIKGGFGVVGPNGLPLPSSASLLWWGAVGLVVGAALLGDRVRAALLIPAALAAFVAEAWLIMRLRGPTDGGGGMWLMAWAIAATGVASTVRGLAARRLAVVMTSVAATTWVLGLVRVLRVEGGAAAIVVAVVAVVALTAVVSVAMLSAGRSDA